MRRFHLILALTCSLFCMATPDFRYPKTVARQAEQDLETALKQRDADKTVDALTRYCLAQSIISRENAADIINRVEQVRRSEPRADLHAMLGVLEMHLYRQLANELWWDIADRNNPTDSLPADVFEWDRVQFENKIRTLFEESTADADLLAQIPLERYPQSVLTDEKSIPYLPTVFDFVMSEANELLSLTPEDVQKWHRIHAADTLASYFLQATYPVSNMAKLPEHEAEALIWKNKLVSDSDYTALQSYARQHTGSRFLPTIRNLIRRIEAKHVTTTLPPEAGRLEPINIAMDIRNVRQGQILIYRIDDETNLSKLQPVRSTAFHVDAQIPFDTTIQMRLDGLDYGRYAIVPAYEADGRMHRPRRVYTHECIQVTDMKTFCTSVENGESYFFVVDAQTGSPLKNVSVYSTQNNKNALIGHTDLQGSVRYRTEYGNYYARQGRDQTCTQYVFREQTADRAAQRHLHASLLTDLGIYRPGETVRMTLVAYYSTITRRDAAGQETFEVVMRDANYQPIDTLVMHTDDWGQATAEAVIPTGRLNGRYQLSIKHMPKDSKQAKETVGAAYFEVSEYKAPTFFIEFNSPQTTYNRNEPVSISGQVMTYSGLPLANTPVTLQLSRSQWAWRYHLQNREQLTDTVIQTNQEGQFDITLPSALFRQDDTDGQTYRSFRTYYLTVRATSPAGESQETSHSFCIGRQREICYNGSTDFINEGSICLPVSMRSSDPADTTATVRYSLALMSDTARIVRQGVLHLPDTRIATRELPSGHYLLRVTCADNDATIPLRQSVVIFRTTDSRCPVDSALWIPQGGCKTDQGKASIIIGCGTDEAHVRYIAYSRTKTLKEGWLHYAKGLHTLQLDMPQGTDEELNVLFVCVSRRQVQTKTIRLRSPEQDSINISIERFQDKAMAGQPVEWTIRVHDAGKRPAHARLMLELYSKALNDLADNTWDFSPGYASPIRANTHFNRLSKCHTSTAYHQPEEKEFDIRPPYLNCYNQTFFASWGTAAANGRIIMRKTASFAGAGIAEDDQVAFAVMKESADAGLDMNDRTGLGETPNPDKVSIREGEEKTVVWEPRLETDSDGSVVLRFDAPESAGRWILQAIAYNENMTAAGLRRELLTQRPLMTQLQLPRFVRQSDLATFSALIQNAADQPQQVTTCLEVIDARTQKTLHAEQQSLIIPASGSKAVTLSINIPDTLSSLIVRVRASSGRFSDGEQQQICVLPNTTPVTESRPFFIRTDEEQCVLDLEAAERATSTIEVCANPVWLCVLALPGITGEHTPTATGIAHR
ncbi:MAG: hypothetical protein IJ680_07500, partial [Paludibacteraceae bacterium]|nr:hypothetical protein [Paludibacteraceae bacterium]